MNKQLESLLDEEIKKAEKNKNGSRFRFYGGFVITSAFEIGACLSENPDLAVGMGFFWLYVNSTTFYNYNNKKSFCNYLKKLKDKIHNII